MDFEEFRRHAHAFSDWMADYLTTVESHPVRAQVRPGEILARLPDACPEEGEAMGAIFDDFRQIILPGVTHWQHPRFFAYFSANSSPPSVLAEMLTATLAAQCMLWETSPAATELELRVTEWLRDLLGLPAVFKGGIHDSASAATLCALIAACERATGGRFSREGLACGPKLTVYCSAEAHFSVEKGARIAGLGAAHVRKLPVGADGGMDAAALAAAVARDRAAGCVPACIVASFGATGAGAIDPLRAIGAIARRENVFLHVDAAWAGSALILPEVRPLIDGIEHADSFVFNPHKWLFTNFDCSLFYLRTPAELTGALSLTPAIMESDAGDALPEYRDWGINLGRRFRALKLWFVLRAYGASGLRDKLRAHIAWVERLAGLIRAAPDFELTSGPRLALLSFRYAPGWVRSEAERDAVNEVLLKRINDGGRLYLSKTRLDGRLVIRFAVGQTYTEWRHVAEGWAAIEEAARALMPEDAGRGG